MSKVVLVTGASGMVGKNVVDRLKKEDYPVLAPTSQDLDLTKQDDVEHYLSREKPDIIIHCAGLVGGIHANMLNPVPYLSKNMYMGMNLVLSAVTNEVGIFINIGSSCMYPRGFEEPLHEDQILTGELEPTNEGYALAKISTAKLCQYVMKEDPLKCYKTLIPCNQYGRYDKYHPRHSHMLPAVIRKIHIAKERNEPIVTIWGDGAARREFMYAGDLADCITLALQKSDSLPEMMNVGLGYDYTIEEYYQIVKKVIGYKGGFDHDLTKPIGMKRKLVNIEKQKAWGWTAKVGIEEGIEAAYKYFLSKVK